MTQAIAEHYRLAQERIAAGKWRVDPDAGHVLSASGRPLYRTNSWGYVQIKIPRSAGAPREIAVLAHRVIWEYVHGQLAHGLQINHKNGTKTDNRIGNLEPVTGAQNVQHAYSLGLNHATRSNRLLSDQDVLRIYQRTQAGERDSPLALEYAVSRSCVNNIRNGWSWVHITGHDARVA